MNDGFAATIMRRVGREALHALVVEVDSEGGAEVFTAFGQRGVSAEAVAATLLQEMEPYLAADVPVGEHLADQLMVPLALAGRGRYRTLPLSEHARTNSATIQRFLPVHIRSTECAGGVEVEIQSQ